MPSNDEKAIRRIVELIRTLRGEGGCPWDREQKLDDILSDLIEEAYELEWAGTRLDEDELFDELGDVLFLLCFAVTIKNETSPRFTIEAIANASHDKIKGRHPHVFGDEEARTPEESIVHWERIKAREREEKPAADGFFADVAGNLPSLRRSEKVQERAASVGFDWDQASGIVAKLREEIDEVEASLTRGSREEIREEIGDLLFSVVNLTRFLKIDASGVLNKSTSKFIDRFEAMKALIDSDQKRMKDMTLDEMDEYWERVKGR